MRPSVSPACLTGPGRADLAQRHRLVPDRDGAGGRVAEDALERGPPLLHAQRVVGVADHCGRAAAQQGRVPDGVRTGTAAQVDQMPVVREQPRGGSGGEPAQGVDHHVVGPLAGRCHGLGQCRHRGRVARIASVRQGDHRIRPGLRGALAGARRSGRGDDPVGRRTGGPAGSRPGRPHCRRRGRAPGRRWPACRDRSGSTRPQRPRARARPPPRSSMSYRDGDQVVVRHDAQLGHAAVTGAHPGGRGEPDPRPRGQPVRLAVRRQPLAPQARTASAGAPKYDVPLAQSWSSGTIGAAVTAHQ